jgi:TPR repeat protein
VFRRFLITLVACSTAWLSAAPAAAAPSRVDFSAELGKASAALARNDYKSAYRDYQRHAARNPLAQFMLGVMDENGWGKPKDAAAACGWYAKSATARIPAAEHHAAECLLRDAPSAADARHALDLYMSAADGGHLISLCAASDLHIRGLGTPKDVAAGLQLCAQAAQAGSPPAMMKMASYYRGDPDVPENPEMARAWLQQAAERGVNEARYQLAIMLSQGEGGAPDVGAALRWMETAAAEGYVPAYLPTATLYASLPHQAGTGAPAPEHLAKVYLWTAAAQARLADPRLLAQAGNLMMQTLALMPSSWRADLDRQVAGHIARFKPAA